MCTRSLTACSSLQLWKLVNMLLKLVSVILQWLTVIISSFSNNTSLWWTHSTLVIDSYKRGKHKCPSLHFTGYD